MPFFTGFAHAFHTRGRLASIYRLPA